MSFTKADLIDQVYASNSKMSKARAREAVEASLLIIKSSLEKGDDVLLSPQTGESMMLGARKVVTFKASGLLRKKMNSK
jgi:integration host factor subunit alpha